MPDPRPAAPQPGPDQSPPTAVVTRLADGHVRIQQGVPEGVAEDPVEVAPGVLAALHDPPGQDPPDHDADGFVDARSALLHRDDAHGLLGAVAVGQWRARARFCSRCGRPLAAERGGRVLRCDDGHQEFPRIEPAVIMRVVDADDRILLGRQPSWPRGRVSVLAGFVDPGEALEDAVRREVMEEVGVTVGDVSYVSSQPWPFPASLMLAFHARAETTAIRLLDDEIAEADWWTRDDLVAAMADGRVAVPPPLSVAHKLVAAWLGRPLTTWTPTR